MSYLSGPGPNPLGGAQRFFLRNLSVAPQAIKSSAGVLYRLTIGNKSGGDAWIQIFDTNGTPTLGNSMSAEIYVPSGTTTSVTFAPSYGHQYTQGIVIAATSIEGGTSSNTVPSGLLVVGGYD